MNDRYFLDTNILVYSLNLEDPRKATISEDLITVGAANGLGCISYQVVQEFFNVALRGFSLRMTPPELERYFYRVLFPLMKVSSSGSLFVEALSLHARNRLSWYDALIVAAAIQGRCKILYSEDLQHGRRFGDLVVQNPFV
jgi:predicted nucleic acid-binding protein